MGAMNAGLQRDPDLAAELEAAFRAELGGRVVAMTTLVSQLANGMADSERGPLVDALARHAHTLKGAAQIVGRARLVAIAGGLEARLRAGSYDDEAAATAVAAIAAMAAQLGIDPPATAGVAADEDSQRFDLAEEAGSASAPFRVVHVEDGSVNRALVRAIFARSTDPLVRNCMLLEADCLEHARALLRTEPVDLVLLDVRLPDGNGLDLARELRATATGTRVVVVSASVMAEDRAAALAAGVEQFISKPVAPAELVATVASLVAERGSPAT